MFECFLSILFLVYCIAWIIYKLRGNSSSSAGRRSSSTGSEETFVNGCSRDEYQKLGFTNDDLVVWGLDQNAAPRPGIARKMILDSLDDFTGEKKDQTDRSNDDLNIFRD